MNPLAAVRKELVFIIGMTPVSCHATGINISDHKHLYMDHINALPPYLYMESDCTSGNG